MITDPEWFSPRVMESQLYEVRFDDLAPGAVVERRFPIAELLSFAPPATIDRIARLQIKGWLPYKSVSGDDAVIVAVSPWIPVSRGLPRQWRPTLGESPSP